ncbi:hypothetical protein DWG88_11070 [Escherichia coli]|nr:hypothetical protein [Escherichia coli]EFA4953766.1 hypothetical protein [Escherichia coli]EFO1475140.1 hypothetical protein [Escherichia coli]
MEGPNAVPDAAGTPYPAYKTTQIQYIAEVRPDKRSASGNFAFVISLKGPFGPFLMVSFNNFQDAVNNKLHTHTNQ